MRLESNSTGLIYDFIMFFCLIWRVPCECTLFDDSRDAESGLHFLVRALFGSFEYWCP